MRVYKFLSKDFALKSMRERRLKISRLSGLNDPFEMFPFDISDRTARTALTMTLREMNERAGVICFSRSWTNPVIWAHYADQHRGICLGFDIPDMFVQEIAYTNHREPFPVDLAERDDADKMNVMNRLLFTKFDHWRYEDEMRVPVRLDPATETHGMYFKDWTDDLKLAEVVVGMRSPTCPRELERTLIDYTEHVEFVKAEASLDSFAVVRSTEPFRNHDDLTYFLKRGRTLHPVEFVR